MKTPCPICSTEVDLDGLNKVTCTKCGEGLVDVTNVPLTDEVLSKLGLFRLK